MFEPTTKTFHCNNCQKQIETDETVWTKWRFPPKNSAGQLKARKDLELQNAPILCETCAKEIITKAF